MRVGIFIEHRRLYQRHGSGDLGRGEQVVDDRDQAVVEIGRFIAQVLVGLLLSMSAKNFT